LRYVVEKGSIAVDGISLTVAAVSSDAFSVSTIPHTVSCTNLCQRHKNDVVNLETDILGKYVEKLFQPIPQEHRQSSVTKEMLIRYGFE
jgi:riboflavin synthase